MSMRKVFDQRHTSLLKRPFEAFKAYDTDRKVRVGFVTGILVAVIASSAVLAGVHMTNAEPFGDTTATKQESSQFGDVGGSDNAAAVQKPSTSSTQAGQSSNTPTTGVAGSAGKYVVLGDSVAAGLGLPLVTTANVQDNTCGRSSQSYGYEVGRQLGRQTTLLACSGATAGDLLTQQRVNGNNPQAQISAAYAGGAPSLISITAGANDMKWQTFIGKCYTSTCGTNTDTNVSDAALVLMRGKLTAALESVKLRGIAGNVQPPTVVVTGYYNPVSTACATDPAFGSRMTAAEVEWLNGRVVKLNDSIARTAANYSFVRFAPVDFTGHDLCSADPWVQGLTAKAPVHPTAAGQQAIAQAVVTAVNASRQ